MEMPVDTSDPNNMVGILINNLVKEENIARQCSPLDSNIFIELWIISLCHTVSIVVWLYQLRNKWNEKKSLATFNDALAQQKYP